MMRSLCLVGISLALVATAGGCAGSQTGGDSVARASARGAGDDDETRVDLAQVPDAVTAAARAAVPGLVIGEAWTETERGVRLYEIVGTAEGERYEVEVTPEGEVVEIEQGKDDDEDEDGDDD